MKPRRLAAYGLVAGLLSGGAAGLSLAGTTLATTRIADVSTDGSTDATATTDTTTATDSTTATTDTTVADPSTTTTAPAADPSTTTTAPAAPAPAAPAAGAAAPAPNHDDWVTGALDPLVKSGTLTQAQEDAVVAALKANKPDHGPGHGPGGHGPDGGRFGNLDAAAKALGMTGDELRTALQGGKSLADVAKSKGIDSAKVVDALLAELKAHFAEEVKSGEHTQADVDKMLADAKARITDFVNGKAPAGGPAFGGPGGHGPGGRGHGGPGGPGGAPANGSAPATTAPASSSVPA